MTETGIWEDYNKINSTLLMHTLISGMGLSTDLSA